MAKRGILLRKTGVFIGIFAITTALAGCENTSDSSGYVSESTDSFWDGDSSTPQDTGSAPLDTDSAPLDTDSVSSQDTDDTGVPASTDSEETVPIDADGDGWAEGDELDCDDQNPFVHPGADEVPANGLDDDCDGQIDEEAVDDPKCFENLDIVFVLDVSTSMTYVLDSLYKEIGVVWNRAMEIDENPKFGLVVFVDDYLVVNAHGYATVGAIQNDFKTWYTHTKSNEQTQSKAQNTDWPENSLDALYAAADKFNWRDDSETLHLIIHATDDTFLEAPKKFSSGIQVQHTYDQTVNRLQAQSVRVASFAAHIGGPKENVNVEPGFFSPYGGRPSIPNATSGNVFELDEVKSGKTSLADAIGDFIADELCQPYTPR